jgi:hypothetical protein
LFVFFVAFLVGIGHGVKRSIVVVVLVVGLVVRILFLSGRRGRPDILFVLVFGIRPVRRPYRKVGVYGGIVFVIVDVGHRDGL